KCRVEFKAPPPTLPDDAPRRPDAFADDTEPRPRPAAEPAPPPRTETDTPRLRRRASADLPDRPGTGTRVIIAVAVLLLLGLIGIIGYGLANVDRTNYGSRSNTTSSRNAAGWEKDQAR